MMHPTEPPPPDETIKKIRGILDTQKLPSSLLGIVCQSGLSTLVNKLSDTVQIPYAQLPGFGQSTGAY